MAKVEGFEPSLTVLETVVLPLHYTDAEGLPLLIESSGASRIAIIVL